MTIANPNSWSLHLLIDYSSIHYVIYNPSEQAVAGSLTIDDAEGQSRLKAIENLIYDNAFLLDDYRRAYVVVRSNRFSLLPPEFAGNARVAVAAHRFSTVSTDNDVEIFGDGGVAVACEADKGLFNFLRRTFNSPAMSHHLQPLISHYKRLAEISTGSRLFVNFHDSETLDLVATDAGARLLLANTITFRNHDDAAFFILNAWKSCGFAGEDDAEVLITGDNNCRSAVSTRLKEYIRDVTLAIATPVIIRLGDAASSLPLELLESVIVQEPK